MKVNCKYTSHSQSQPRYNPRDSDETTVYNCQQGLVTAWENTLTGNVASQVEAIKGSRMWIPMPRAISKVHSIMERAGWARSRSYNTSCLAVQVCGQETLDFLKSRCVYRFSGYEPPNAEGLVG